MIRSNFEQNYAVGFVMAAMTLMVVLVELLRGAASINTLILVFLMASIFVITTFFKNLPYHSNLVETKDLIIANHFFYHHQTIYIRDIREVTLCGRQMRRRYELTISFFEKYNTNEFIFCSPSEEEIENFTAIMKNKGINVIIDSNHEQRKHRS
jgi:hypothetical protein